ncbi:hypothetical protein H0H93_007286, partial [Arthromyces matolae]
MEVFDKAAPDSSTKQIKRDLFQRIWELLLSCKEFREAYMKGLTIWNGQSVIVALDVRSFADIESDSVLVACIKSYGRFLCATCKTTREQVLRLGTKLHDVTWMSKERVDSAQEQFNVEAARKKIYESGFVADGKPIDRILDYSKTPIR